jgi:hypothetical protein
MDRRETGCSVTVCTHLAQVTDQRMTLVKTVMNILDP